MMLNIYFDETNHTRKISVSRKKETLTYDEKNESWFWFVFLSVNNEEVFVNEFLELEKKYFKTSANSGEIKSNTLLSKVNNWDNLKYNNKLFYANLLELVVKHKKLLQVGSINKISELISRWLKYIYHNLNLNNDFGFDKHLFMIFISKFINNNCQFEFLTYIKEETNIKKQLIFVQNLLKDSINVIDVNNFDWMKNSFYQTFEIINWLISEIHDGLTYKFIFHFDYSFLNYSIMQLLKETKVYNFNIVIDNEKKVFETMKKYYDNVEEKDSKDTPLIRVCDHIIGLFRAISNIINSTHRFTRKIDKNFKKSTDYPNTIFNVDKITLKIIHQIWLLFSGIYWETFSNLTNDEFIAVICYIQLMANNKNVTSSMLMEKVHQKLVTGWYK